MRRITGLSIHTLCTALISSALLILSGCSSVYLNHFYSSTPRLFPEHFETTKALETRDRNFEWLKKGVNIQGLCINNKTTVLVKRKKHCVQAKDLKLIRAMGFRHVRLLIEPSQIFSYSAKDNINRPGLDFIKSFTKQLLENDLAIIIDIHPNTVQDTYLKEPLSKNDSFVKKYLAFLEKIAAEFSALDKQRIFFEPLNEPFFYEFMAEGSDERWWKVQNQMIAAIRKSAPENTIIVTDDGYGALGNIYQMIEVADKNVVYTAHYYTPLEFTAQGSKWGRGDIGNLTYLPYPGDLLAVQKRIQNLPDDAKPFARRYQRSLMRKEHFEQDFLLAANWALKHNVKLYVGEFGVIKKNVYPEDRARYLRDVRQVFEHFGMGWGVWEYNQDYAITAEKNGQRIPAPLILKALGLNI